MRQERKQTASKGRKEQHCWKVNMDLNNTGLKIYLFKSALQMFYGEGNAFSPFELNHTHNTFW